MTDNSSRVTEIAEHVRRAIAEAPPLTETQIERIARLLATSEVA